MCSPLAALAVPAYPGLIKQINPDGEAVEIRLRGDEYFSYATDAAGRWLMEQNAAGYWAVMTRGGMQMAATADNINMLREAQDASFGSNTIEPIARYAELSDTDGRSKFPSVGTGDYLIVLLQYKDVKFSMADPQKYYQDWFNKQNFVDEDIKLSARDYYIKVSDGKFKPNFVISPVITLPRTSQFYVGSGGKYSYFSRAIRDALTQLESQNFDFSRFDLDNDGVIDNIYFIYAGYGQADTGDTSTIWPHASSYSGTYGGKAGGRYACSNELRGSHRYLNDKRKTGIGTFCHEFGHVLGLPDMYDPNYNPECEALTPGNWSIMCNGSYLGDGCLPAGYAAYDRWACRWMEYTEVEAEKEYSLPPLVNAAPVAYRLKVPTSASFSEYYVFENRTQKDVDTNVPASGMLVWHVDYDYWVWRSNRVNSTASHMRLTVVPPVGQTRDFAQWPAAGPYGKVIAPEIPSALTPFNTPTQTWTPCLYDIAYNNDTQNASFKYTKQAPKYDGLVAPKAGKLNEGKQEGMKICWNHLPEATGYIITVQRRNSSGSTFYVDNCNDKLVNDTKIFINESAAMQRQDNRYTIRAIGPVLPSSKVFDSGWFKPEELPSYDPNWEDGVDGITADDLDITIENGNIIAPQGTRVFNMSGMETGTENLAPGIYIVRVGLKALKVVVR